MSKWYSKRILLNGGMRWAILWHMVILGKVFTARHSTDERLITGLYVDDTRLEIHK